MTGGDKTEMENNDGAGNGEGCQVVMTVTMGISDGQWLHWQPWWGQVAGNENGGGCLAAVATLIEGVGKGQWRMSERDCEGCQVGGMDNNNETIHRNKNEKIKIYKQKKKYWL